MKPHTFALLASIAAVQPSCVSPVVGGGADRKAALTPDHKRGFVADEASGAVDEIDPQSGRVLRALPVGPTPREPALTSDGWLFVPLAGGEGIAVVDVADDAFLLAGKLDTGPGTRPAEVALSADQKRLWATVGGAETKLMSWDLTSDAPPAEYRLEVGSR